jgi:hypothetical protein
MKKVCLFILILSLFVSTSALGATALWTHSESPEVVKYRISWGTTPGVYTFSQEMNKSDCVGGVDIQGETYDCKLPLTGTFVDNVSYYYTGYAIAYKLDGTEWPSLPVPEQVFIKRPDGTTTPTQPKPMRELGIYDE